MTAGRRLKPRLYVVARPTLDEAEIAAFLANEERSWRRTDGATGPEELLELAGRVCYLSFGVAQSGRSNAEYIARLVDQGHESVLEHATWSFLLTGVSRGFTHQFVRHRIGFSFSQLSQQYHDESDADAVMPEVVRRDEESAELFNEAVDHGQRAYRALLARLESTAGEREDRERLRLIRTAARSVLPAATETKIFFSANGRSLRHFLTERGGIPGDEEMRVVSALLAAALRREAPALVADFTLEERDDGLPLVKRHR
ncbi:MAG: FAD-dependent thymidylate synthase [Actinomycetota bacterium]|nr:FAD-dependent thymidylate synthase [Actinomycetota bacterium]MDQ5807552.1 FAD-dependent thymidylate synthase [Actinomycetota bacterium]